MKIFKRVLSIFLRVGISVILLIFLFSKVDRKSLAEIIKNADKGFLFLAFFIFFFSYIVALLRWEMLLKAVKIHLPLKRVIISFAGGIYFNLFLPSSIGGDLVRTLDLSAHTKRPREVVATVFLDRVSGYTGLVILALLALLFGWDLLQDPIILLSVAIITLVLLTVLLVLFNSFVYSKVNSLLHSPRPCAQRQGLPTAGKIRESIKNLHQEMHLFRHHKYIIFKNILFSILVQVIAPLTFYIIALALGVKVNIIYFFIFLPIIGAITLLPISLGGLGLRDVMAIFLFAKAGMAKNTAFAMSLINFFFILICASIGGLIYVLTVHHRRLQHHPSPRFHPAGQ